MDERNSIISLETARNGSTIPVVNGVYLHSIYDPEKEAEAFVDTFEKQLSQKTHVLILGLGFGYHIKKVTEFLRQAHGSFHITVLEPNEELINIVKAHRNFSQDEVSILSLDESKELYKNREFINFLMKKPCLLKHESSFSLNRDKFTDFLTYKPSRKLESFKAQFSEETNELFDLELGKSFKDSAHSLRSRKSLSSRAQYLTLALDTILQKENEGQI